MKRRIKELVLITMLLFFSLVTVGHLLSTVNFFRWIGLSRTLNAAATAYMEHETAGKLNFTTTLAGIGTLELIGVNHVININIGTSLVDGFVPASADSDNGFGLPTDFVIDSLRFFSSDEAAGDSSIWRLYKNSATATLISGPDTLTGNGKIDYTAIALATRDFDASANEKFALTVDVKGTYTDALVQVFGRTFDVK